MDASGYTTSASTSLDPLVVDPAAVLEVMAHEIGHPAGLGDCPTCAATASVMGNGPPRGEYNTVVGRPTTPSPCDSNKLQSADYPYCNPPVNGSCVIWDPNPCTCNQYFGGLGGDPNIYPETGGGGYGGYSCTPYYWLYFTSYDGGETWQFDDISYAGCW